MKTNPKYILAGALCAFLAINSTQAQVLVYNTLDSGPVAGYTDLNSNHPIFGDSLTLAQGGQLSVFGLSLFNSSTAGNTGSILTGSTLVKFYDNTVPYAGGVLSNPLVGTAVINWDFTVDGGLPVGYFATDGSDLTSLNIMLPKEVLITQQFTQTTGTSLRNGMVLFNNSPIGSSPNTVYIKSDATPEGLYTFTGNPQVGFYVEVVPEPSILALAGLGTMALAFRRRK